MIVMKFGGTSVESASAIERVAEIVKENVPCRPIVVVSAMRKTTNALLAMGRDAAEGKREAALDEMEALKNFHRREMYPVISPNDRYELNRILDEHFNELSDILKGLAALGELTPRSSDAIASFGERISSTIFAMALRARGIPGVHLDSRKLIVTDERFTQASPLYGQTFSRLAGAISSLDKHDVPVLGGFIAATENGVTSTLGRGGSDFTASIVGAAVDATEIQIWTDVDGMLTSDPSLVPDAHRVKTLSFAEASELAYFGARVLHPSTVLPAMRKGIPVRILNSRRPESPGTLIVAEPVPCSNILKCVAFKRQITVVNVHSTHMLMAHGFLHRIFEIFDRFETPVDMLATSEVSVSLTIDNPARLDAICDELRPFSQVSVENDQAIVCVVGENIRHTPGVAARVFGAIHDVNVRAISQGASLLNLSFVVAAADLPRAVRALHKEFFTELDPMVFD
jgi:aspartate kinase